MCLTVQEPKTFISFQEWIRYYETVWMCPVNRRCYFFLNFKSSVSLLRSDPWLQLTPVTQTFLTPGQTFSLGSRPFYTSLHLILTSGVSRPCQIPNWSCVRKGLVFCSGPAWAPSCTAENPGAIITSSAFLLSHPSSQPSHSFFQLITPLKPSLILHTCLYAPASDSELIASVFLAAPSTDPSLPSRSSPELQPKSLFILAVLWVYFLLCVGGCLFCSALLHCPSLISWLRAVGNGYSLLVITAFWLSVSSVPLNVCLDYLLKFQPSLFSLFPPLSSGVSLYFDHLLLLKSYDRSSVSLLTSGTNLIPSFCQVLSVWL